jgi:hypothetical protein
MKDASPLQQLSDEIGDCRLLFYGARGEAATVGAHSGVARTQALSPFRLNNCFSGRGLGVGLNLNPNPCLFAADYGILVFLEIVCLQSKMDHAQ